MRHLPKAIAAYVRAHSLLQPGDRVAVAVSGGADSVGLLRILLELREQLGLVISAAHFHHGIRGVDADRDAVFVEELARVHGLEFHLGRGDATEKSRVEKISLEAAARSLRRAFFGDLLECGKANVVATAHTLDDQAETVLMKALRGAGTRGLAGIFPEQKLSKGRIVRPLLHTRREQIREYLRELNQDWREDLSNADTRFTRNRLRTKVMPVLRAEINPSVDVALANAGEIARSEEEYWDSQVARLLPTIVVPGEPARGGGRKQTSAATVALDLSKFNQHPLAVRRRLLRSAAEQLGCGLDFEHLQAILDLIASRAGQGARNRTIEIADGWRARLLFRELRLERTTEAGGIDYECRLAVPGEVHVAELGIRIRARIIEDNGAREDASYNRADSLNVHDLSEPLLIRNWRSGDRFRPLRHSSKKRLKELLYPLHLAEEEKRLWPVAVLRDQVVWVRGVDSPELRTASGQRLCIEESRE